MQTSGLKKRYKKRAPRRPKSKYCIRYTEKLSPQPQDLLAFGL
jgi:hypothetical protein